MLHWQEFWGLWCWVTLISVAFIPCWIVGRNHWLWYVAAAAHAALGLSVWSYYVLLYGWG